MNRCLFVYGTLMLAAGREVGRRLASEAVLLGHGSVPGRLYDLGKWPGVVPAQRAHERVWGEVWRLADPVSSLIWLDEYEGIKPNVLRPEYARIVTRVAMNSGAVVPVWMYSYLWPLTAGTHIPDGRWPPAWGEAALPALAGAA